MLDKLDKQIIGELEGNARRSYTDLAKVLEVSEGTIRNRVKNLQKSDVIKLEAVLNPYSIGYDFITVMALEVKVADLSIVSDMLVKLPNIYYLAYVTGRYDIVAIVMTRSTQELAEFIKQHISNIPSILHCETLVNLEVVKSPWTHNASVNQLINMIPND